MDEKSESGGRKRLPFNWIRRDLDRALAMAGLEKLEARLMVIARELCYGLAQQQGNDAEPVPFQFNIKAIARDWGNSPFNLRAARQRLIDDRLLVETPGGLIVNKAYEEWEGAHALAPLEVRTALDARRRGAIQKYGKGGTSACPPDEAEGGHVSVPPKGARQRAPLNKRTGHVSVPPKGHVSVPPPSSVDVFRDLETSKTTTSSRTCAGGESPNAPSGPAEQTAVIEFVQRLNFSYEVWARDACEVWPADWVRTVASKYLPGCNKSPMEYSKYLNSILTRWARQGHPDDDGFQGKRAPAGDAAPTNVLRLPERKEANR